MDSPQPVYIQRPGAKLPCTVPKEQGGFRIGCPADGFVGMKVLGRNYLERKKAGLALIDAVAGVSEMEPVEIGSYRGFAIMTRLTAFDDHKTMFKGAVTYTIDLSDSAAGNITRIDNALGKLPAHLKEY